LEDLSTSGGGGGVLKLQSGTTKTTKGMNEYKLRPGNSSQYTIRCKVKGSAKIKHMEFQYDGQTRRDYLAPWYMGGGGILFKAPVDYLSQGCGTKEVVVSGTNWRGSTCFQETFILQAKCK
jgi:hypothetical protein